MQTVSMAHRAILGKVVSLSRTAYGLAYWETDASVAAIARHFHCTGPQLRKLAGLGRVKDIACPGCGGPMTASGREIAWHILSTPDYPADADQGLIPGCADCCRHGTLVSWYFNGVSWGTDEPGGGAIGARWRRMRGK